MRQPYRAPLKRFLYGLGGGLLAIGTVLGVIGLSDKIARDPNTIANRLQYLESRVNHLDREVTVMRLIQSGRLKIETSKGTK
jgi:hypothetical protein